eukprot:CAMPEP_0197492822 /NCGR_PEP_ID=MMETSP1311-20131121/15635_1 /TAXON_ID=464262 /ORGANISM="Genus nov. species nov., Strain RCC856" /LENGTH=147 /DNA_ID=CAMNT_0043037935 /DNA_START=27 /DNA_END=470 /DNA_ORIENTATION=-
MKAAGRGREEAERPMERTSVVCWEMNFYGRETELAKAPVQRRYMFHPVRRNEGGKMQEHWSVPASRRWKSGHGGGERAGALGEAGAAAPMAATTTAAADDHCLSSRSIESNESETIGFARPLAPTRSASAPSFLELLQGWNDATPYP